MSKHAPFLIEAGWLPSLVFLLHCVLSLAFDAYDRIPSLDVPMHLLGGAAIAYFFHVVVAYCDRLGWVRTGSKAAEMIMVFGLVALAAVVWEFAEFLADWFFRLGAQPSLANTMKDQFMGLAGGAAYIGSRLRSAPAASPGLLREN